jgi:uncharacterized protein (DUF4415 family)
MTYDDDDGPELTAELAKSARRGRDVLPEAILSQFPRGRGRPRSETAKAPVSLRLDQDVLDAWKSTGAGWQTRMNDALRAAILPNPKVL